MYKDVVPDTAQWIFSKSQYREWQVSSACSILWLHGMPGCGKTKLTSTVIQQHMDATRKSDQSAPIAYVYCSNSRRNPTMVLRSIVKQLAVSQSGHKIQQPLWEDHRRRQEAADMDGLDSSPLTIDECTQMLRTMTVDCPATIIIDGLDELDGQRLDLLAAFHTLINEASSVVKIMISSREDTDITQELQNAMSIRVSASENSIDIEKFVQHRVSLVITNQRLLGGAVSGALKGHIVDALLEGAGGMFLCPAMQLEYLCDRNIFKVEADVITAVKALPPTLVGTFDRLYARIHSYGNHGKIIVTRIFAWLLAAERALSMSELICAVSFRGEDFDAEYITSQHFYNAQMILDLCCNFVSLDESSQQISLVHASVREYLKMLPEYSISMNNFVAAKRCLDLFMFDDDDTTDVDIDNGIDSFREYAICHWAHHFSETADVVLKSKLGAILKKFISEEEAMTFSQFLEDVKELVESKRPGPSHLKELNTILNDHGSAIFMACVYGIPAILEKIESDASHTGRTVDYNAKNANGVSVLYISARYGRTDTLRFLLIHGGKVDVFGGFFGNPLQASAFHGHHDIVRFLLEEKADVFANAGANVYTYHSPYSSCDDDSETSSETSQRVEVRAHAKFSLLQIALDSRLKSEWSGTATSAWKEPLQKTWGPIVCCLLGADLEVDLESPSLVKFFYISCFQGELDYVKKLLAKDVRLIGQAGSGNDPSYPLGTALHSATVGGQKSVAKLLLEHGADVRVKGDNRYRGKTENQSAVETAVDNRIYNKQLSRKYSSVLKTCAYLVDSGASESDSKIVLRKACKNGDVEVTKQILQHVAKIQGLPPTNNVELYHLLVHSESYIDSRPDFISNLQLGAIRQGDIPFLANLVDRYGPQDGPDKTRDIVTAFIECKGDRTSILRYLVQNFFFNINTMYPEWRRSTKMINPLLHATSISHNPEAVEFLSKEGVNPDSPDLQQTPLMSTLEETIHPIRIGQSQSIIRIVKSLLQYGADANGSRKIDREADDSLKPQFHKTPLIYAIWWNRRCVDALEVVQLLVDHNADINHGEITPLQLARYFGRPETENLLSQHGAKDDGDPTRSVVADYVNKFREDCDIY